MVKKLFKYEFQYYLKALLPFQLIIPVTALLNRLIQFLETDSDVYNIIFGSSVFMFCASIFVSFVMAFVLSIARFHKNLFTSEGYLTMVLPVNVTQHILVKLTTSFVFFIITVINVFISLCVITSGELLVEIFKAISYLLRQYADSFGINLPFYIIEIILLVAVTFLCNMLLFYGCITIGQTAKKNRVLMAFVTYFIYYVICQILGTIFIVFTITFSPFISELTRIIFNIFNEYQIAHMVLCFFIIFNAVLGFVYFLVSRHIMSKKLNLE